MAYTDPEGIKDGSRGSRTHGRERKFAAQVRTGGNAVRRLRKSTDLRTRQNAVFFFDALRGRSLAGARTTGGVAALTPG